MKQAIRNTIDDLVSGLLYYDRKKDEDLPPGAIQEAVKNGEITIDQIVIEFRKHLVEGFKNEN